MHRQKVESLAYISAADSMGLVEGSKRRMLFAIECVMTVQGHPRSLILPPIERAYVDFLSLKSVMLAGPKSARNPLETCSLASLRLACVRDRVAFSKVHHASKSENLFACINPTDLT